MSFTIERVRHQLEVRLLTVTAVEELTSAMRRITLTGPLSAFVSGGPDDHVKLIFPFPGQTEIVLPELGEQGISRTAKRPPMRDYTPRRFDPDAGELVIDVVVHGYGPGAKWASGARPGTTVGQIGPRGSARLEGNPDWYLLAGDETAIPSIARRLEGLPADTTAVVLIEVDGPADELPLAVGGLKVEAAPAVELHWLHRGGAIAGRVLTDAVRALQLPPGDGYAWVATEADAARELRRHLREERGLSRGSTKITGYWKLGTSDHHDAPDA